MTQGLCLQWPTLLSDPKSSSSIMAWKYKGLAACRLTFPRELCLPPQLLKKSLLLGSVVGPPISLNSLVEQLLPSFL